MNKGDTIVLTVGGVGATTSAKITSGVESYSSPQVTSGANGGAGTDGGGGAGGAGAANQSGSVLSSNGADGVRCEVKDFRSSSSVMSADIAQARFVRYTIAD